MLLSMSVIFMFSGYSLSIRIRPVLFCDQITFSADTARRQLPQLFFIGDGHVPPGQYDGPLGL